MRLPHLAPCQPVPAISIPGINADVRGFWSLWRISIATTEWNRLRIMPLFVDDTGSVLFPTARHIWDQLLAACPQVRRLLNTEESQTAFAAQQKAAEEHGKQTYDSLAHDHRAFVAREREKFDYALSARRKAVSRIGLPQVRDHRLNLLTKEEQEFQNELDKKARLYPEMTPLLMVRVEGDGHE